MKVLRWLLPLVSLAIVLAVTLWDLGGARLGPGPLHPAHAALPELAGGSHCDACHRAGAGIDADACTKCHVAIGAQLGAARGLHGGIAAGLQRRCGTCHPEHHGALAPLIAGHAFATAGFPAGTPYDHRHVEFGLAGTHRGLACTQCHIAADAVEPPAGGRYLGLTQACTACHEDVHRAAFGPGCEDCHGQERPFREAPGFRHATFVLEGAHRRVACADCHAAGTPRDVAALRRQPLPARACGDCHADPHGASAPRALRLERTADCARCHDATQWRAARPTGEQHAAAGFPLRSGHATAACAACHGDATTPARWRGAAPALAACGACHTRHPHAQAVVLAATAAVGPVDGCAGCHHDSDASFRDGTMDAGQHAATGFALVTPHADVACAGCHRGPDWSARFPGRRGDDCRGCHQDVHRGQFDHEPRHAQCTACHAPARARFLPHTFGIAAHAASSFPLTGAHEAVACTRCHQEVREGVRTFHGTPQECAACHVDVHAGRFDGGGRAPTVDGRRGCARCHDTRAFAPVVAGFDHDRWTGYALTGAHAQVACAACHPAGTGGATAPRLGKAAGTTCAACHTDPHAGQFAIAGATDCGRCHGDRAWSELRFDHQRDSRFPLDGLHARVECSRCHVGYAAGGRLVVRYKPLGVTCGDCHKLGKAGEVLR